MTKYPLFIILSIFALSVNGQPGALKLTTTRNDDKSVDFSYEKKYHGSYYLEVYLTSLNNTVHNGYRGVIKNNRGKIFRLRPQNENASIGFNYSYKYLRGSPNPKFDKDFRYLLPYRGTAQVEDLSNLNVEYFGARQAKDWRALMFKLTPGDTIYAARKGLVVEVVNHHLPDTTNAYSYYPLVNYIIVEHPDGTFAKYTGFYSEKINVLPGQTIFPNDPIGIVAQYDSEGIAQLRFQVYYLNFANSEGGRK